MTNAPMTILHEAALTLWGRKWLALALFLAVAGPGLALTLSIRPTYEATLRILVTRDRIDPRITAKDNALEGTGNGVAEEEFNSELELLQSRQVLENVVQELNLTQPAPLPPDKGLLAKLRQVFGGSVAQAAGPLAPEQALRQLRSGLSVEAVRKSRVILATYRDADPHRAAQVLNALYRRYVDYRLKLNPNTRAAEVFHEQTAAYNRKLFDATAQLKQFGREHALADPTQQKGELLRQLYQAQNQADTTATTIAETGKRLTILRAQMAAQPERIETETRTRYTGALDRMKEELLSLEMQRTQLAQKYKADSRPVREIEERIAQARAAIAREESAPPEEKAFALNDVRRRLENEMLSAQAELRALEERRKGLQGVAAQYQAKILELDQRGFEKADLERERNIQEQAYLLYQKKAQEAEIVSALNKEKIANISLVEAAQPDDKPVAPKTRLNLAVIFLASALVALVLPLGLEKFYPVARSKASVRRYLGLDVIAALPRK